MQKTLDELMDDASVLLVKMQYAKAQAICEQALAQCKAQALWGYVSQVLLPLQECRRQRRLIAIEADVFLGTLSPDTDLHALVGARPAGAAVLTGPGAQAQARALAELAQKNSLDWVVLVGQTLADGRWKVQSFVPGSNHAAELPAPPAAWQNTWLTQGHGPSATPALPDGTTPGGWVLRASEKLGDAGLAHVREAFAQPSLDKIQALEQCLLGVSDHELLIQEYQKTARQLHARA